MNDNLKGCMNGMEILRGEFSGCDGSDCEEIGSKISSCIGSVGVSVGCLKGVSVGCLEGVSMVV